MGKQSLDYILVSPWFRKSLKKYIHPHVNHVNFDQINYWNKAERSKKQNNVII